ncbi:Mov34/MPN/PAD-1 family protein [Priestia megaterium]
MEQGIELLIPKIPFKYLQMALSFYLDVYDKDKTEASLLFFWNKDNKTLPATYSDGSPVKGLLTDDQLVIYVPQQVNSSGLSVFKNDKTVDWLRENLSLLAETHSHHTMNAFFSGTDDANENATQFYGVWGRIKNEQPAFAFRYVSGEAKNEICPSVLFDWPKELVKTTVSIRTNLEGVEEKTFEEKEMGLYHGPFPKIDYPAEWMEQHKRNATFDGITANKLSYTPGQRTYISQHDGRLEQLEADLPFSEEDLYNYKSNEHIVQQQTIFESSKFEDAEIVQFIDLKDEKRTFDIKDDIYDLTADYSRLGYDTVIESAIDAL